jgi:hypothetical protein
MLESYEGGKESASSLVHELRKMDEKLQQKESLSRARKDPADNTQLYLDSISQKLQALEKL